ncbi:hypothetical protein E2C01_039291 [Portunus trituberculatus]|uniref:Uncharacterized protein n=1 Tax=Portunus trituberculatus TaxID=210409 RepID=A0A5B7FKZ6_PORTR|nr:hypothetical protein [Portunus trituberculatus]
MRGSSTTPTSINILPRNVEGKAAALHLSISPLLLRREDPIRQAEHSVWGGVPRETFRPRRESRGALTALKPLVVLLSGK